MLKLNDTKMSDINPVEDFDELFNSEKGPSKVIATESVRTYYAKSSHGRLSVNNVLTGWIDLPFSEAYVAGACVNLTVPDSKDKDGLDCPNGLNVREAIMEGLRRFELKVNNSAFFKQFDVST
jgi:M6 family metalloprotease-like protein